MLKRIGGLCAALLALSISGSVAMAAETSALEAPASQEDFQTIGTARALNREGRYLEAVELLEPLNRVSMSSPIARTEQQKSLGQAYIGLNDFAAAIAAFTNVIDYPRADRTTALVNRCYAYIQVNLLLDAQSDCAAARADLERAAYSGNSEDHVILNFRRVSFAMVEADLALRSGQPMVALAGVRDAIAIVESHDYFYPEDYWSLYLLQARVIGETGDPEDAISAIEALMPTIPEEERSEAIAARAGLHLRTGNVDAAVADWSEAAELVASELDKAEFMFRGCTALLRAGRPEDATESCQSATMLSSHNARYDQAYKYAVQEAGKQ